MGVRLMKKRRPGNQRHWSFHGVPEVEIFFAGFCTPAHSQNSIFAVEINCDALRQMAGDEIGNSPAEIYIRAVSEFARGPLRDLLARQSRLVRRGFLLHAVTWHALFPDAITRHVFFLNAVTRHVFFLDAVTRHIGFLSLARCDERRSRESRRVPD